jgi:iron complex outermembrane receptor protein
MKGDRIALSFGCYTVFKSHKKGILFFLYTLYPFFIPVIGICQEQLSTSIYGFVTDDATNTPLINASVVLVNTVNGTSTDSDGRFSIKNIAAGNYVIRVSFIGYQTFEKKIELKNKQNLHLNIALKDTSITTKEIQITGYRNRDVLNQSDRINIITLKNIESAPVQNIPALIDYSPGVTMNNTFGIFSSKAIVTLHGLPANDQSRTLVLLDGIPLNKSDEGSVNWNMINKNNIQSIKVMKGPGPAKYGSGAMGGVIEITSKRPAKIIEGEIQAEYGTYNTIGTNIGLSGALNDTSSGHVLYWGISGFGRESDGYITELDQFKTFADTILVPTYLKELNGNVKLGYTFNRNQKAEIQFNYYDDIRGNGVKVFENLGAYSTHRTYSGIAKYSGKCGIIKWNANFFDLHENYIRQYEYMKEGEYKLYCANSIRQDMGGNIEMTTNRFLRHELTTGINYKIGSVNGTDTYYTSTDIIYNKGKMHTIAVFLQDGMKFMKDRLQINAGIRYDFAMFYDGLFAIDYPSYSIEFYENFENRTIPSKQWIAFCPRLSAQYKFTETDRTYLSIARGFRAPILDDMTRTGKRKGGFSRANPDLKPELITTYEIGGDKALINSLTASVSVFYSLGQDFMYYVSTGDTVNMGYKLSPILKKQNISKVEIYGSEVEFKYNFNEVTSIFANYSYTHAQIMEYRLADEKTDSCLTGKYLTDVPNHKIGTGITWMNKIVNTSVLFKYVGKTWINDLNVIDEEYLKTDRFPDYTTLNIRFERPIVKKLITSLSIENIFNTIFVNNDAQRNPGRLINGSLKLTF